MISYKLPVVISLDFELGGTKMNWLSYQLFGRHILTCL